MVPEFPLSTGFLRKKLGLSLRQVLGMDDYGSDKGGLLTGAQSQQNNWKWHWQDQGSVDWNVFEEI